MRDAEHAGEFALEVEQRARLGGILIEEIERAPEQVVQFGRGVIGLGREFDQLDEMRRECDAAVVGAEPGACVAQVGLTERVQVAFCAACDGDVAVEKRSSTPAKRLFGRSAPFTTVFSRPESRVNHETMRLVSLNRVFRSRMASVVCTPR